MHQGIVEHCSPDICLLYLAACCFIYSCTELFFPFVVCFINNVLFQEMLSNRFFSFKQLFPLHLQSSYRNLITAQNMAWYAVFFMEHILFLK